MRWVGDPGFWLGLAFVACGLYSFVNYLLAVKNVRPGVSRSQFLFNDFRFFDESKFTERGQRYQAQAGLGFVLAFVVLALGILLVVITS